MIVEPSTHVTLISSDGFEFIVRRDCAYHSKTIKTMLDPTSRSKSFVFPMRDTEGPRAEWSVLCRQLLRSLFWPLYFPWHKVSSSILTARYCYLSSSCDGPDPSWCTRIWAAGFFWKKSASISITTKNTKGHETYQIWRSQRICAFSC